MVSPKIVSYIAHDQQDQNEMIKDAILPPVMEKLEDLQQRVAKLEAHFTVDKPVDNAEG